MEVILELLILTTYLLNMNKGCSQNNEVSSIKRFFDNIIYESNPQNDDFYDLLFDGDERLIVKK